MSAPPRSQTFAFEVEYQGKTYQCSRQVTGTRNLYQVISVQGVGSKHDSAMYRGPGGRSGHPASTMEGIARLIASEILGDPTGRT